MAEHFSVIGSYSTVQVTGPDTAQDVLRISFRTIPSGVIAQVNVPYRNIAGVRKMDAQQAADVFIAPMAAGIETTVTLPHVAGASSSQDTDASGLLVDYLDVVVEYQPADPNAGVLTDVARIPLHALGETQFYSRLVEAPINAVYSALVALAGA